MSRNQWERQFTRQIKQKLGIAPEKIRFRWRGYYNQRYSVDSAIASLIETHRLYPMLGVLPNKKEKV